MIPMKLNYPPGLNYFRSYRSRYNYHFYRLMRGASDGLRIDDTPDGPTLRLKVRLVTFFLL